MSNENEIEDQILALSAGILALVFAVPFLSYKFVESKAEEFRVKRYSELIRPVIFHFLASVISISPILIFRRHLDLLSVDFEGTVISLVPFIKIISLNFMCSSLLFITIPLWITFLPKKMKIDDRIY